MDNNETPLFDVPEILSPREAWMRKNNVTVHHDPGVPDSWRATSMEVTAMAETRDDALAMLAHKLGKLGIPHWVAPMGGGAE